MKYGQSGLPIHLEKIILENDSSNEYAEYINIMSELNKSIRELHQELVLIGRNTKYIKNTYNRDLNDQERNQKQFNKKEAFTNLANYLQDNKSDLIKLFVFIKNNKGYKTNYIDEYAEIISQVLNMTYYVMSTNDIYDSLLNKDDLLSNIKLLYRKLNDKIINDQPPLGLPNGIEGIDKYLNYLKNIINKKSTDNKINNNIIFQKNKNKFYNYDES